jgi:hypothetical protein
MMAMVSLAILCMSPIRAISGSYRHAGIYAALREITEFPRGHKNGVSRKSIRKRSEPAQPAARRFERFCEGMSSDVLVSFAMETFPIEALSLGRRLERRMATLQGKGKKESVR